ncbi:ABC transporter ATP-binding protein [Clostridium sp. FP1]|uniref:ABC transporter ATP-binding protein n=1 Tax=Clostridium sp. FP1 TaxID=2724076 RepID=UPI0013E94608|nr:ABC transporter ATP-binding protein [Clostridium sp. FP1]MBZ9637682.1 ABC transporter ATP-binding protein [Clostridium sp. FP1]
MILKIDNVVKSFGKNKALNGINIVLRPGIYGLLGPNGAGKTTLMRILTTVLNQDIGEITYGDLNWDNKNNVRKIIGYLPQKFSLYKSLTIIQALEHIGVLKGIKKDLNDQVIDVIEKVNLMDHKDKKIGQLSGGMIRRVGIAQAILGNPKILVVDEPTAGLDPEERMRFRNLIKGLSSTNIVIISTHIVEDVEMMCENVAIINKGQVILEGEIEEIKNSSKGISWEFEISSDEFLNLQDKLKITQQNKTNTGYKLRVISIHKPYQSAKEVQPTLEEIYLNLVS